MALRVSTSEKGKRKLIDNGHVYINDKSKRCHGRVHTIGDSFAKRIGVHNHSGNTCRAEVLDVMHNIIDRAVATQDGPQNNVANVLNLASKPALGQLTSVNNIKSVIRRARKPNPLSLQDLVILGELNKTLKSTLIFSTDRNMQRLARSQHWYADGTVKTVPPLFMDLLTIILYQLFRFNVGKTEESYRMLYRNIRSNGLQHRYENDADFAMQMRHLPSLAFVPVEDAVLALNNYFHVLIFLWNHSSQYLTTLKIYGLDGLTRGNQLVTTTLTMIFQRRTTAVEGWYRSFRELIGGNHPTTGIWKFITVLQKEQGLNKAKIEQSLAGQPIQH
ncbi:hypothetical protein ACJMK2_014770 [Sinanodonta woodiana]|uniref:Uncharacterized protein n=1 Tax=Sinanodonta woodiana TaxID=1069815 RepID=A0ABD3V450_SINWO